MEFQFQYRITYGNGQFYDRQHIMSVQISMDEYKKIILGVLEGKRIEEIDDISEIIDSRNPCSSIIREADYFISAIV